MENKLSQNINNSQAELNVYKSLLSDEIILSKSVPSGEILGKIIYDCKELHGQHVMVFVNDNVLLVDDWHLFKTEPFDRIKIVPELHGGGVLEVVGAVVGAVVGIATMGVGFAGAFGLFSNMAIGMAAIKGAIIGYTLGSMADSIINPPTMPELPSFVGPNDASGSDPNYSWSGARLVTQPDGPVNILYGQHEISGTLIMQYVSTSGNKNYLHMLIALGEGEIDGIMKSDLSGVCTSIANLPYIKINGQLLENFEGVQWNYRTGTNDQSIIPGFHKTSTYYADGRKISYGSPVEYTTTGLDIEDIGIHLMSPSLFVQDDKGNILDNTIRYRIKYRIHGAGSWTTLNTFTVTAKSKTAVNFYQDIPDYERLSGDLTNPQRWFVWPGYWYSINAKASSTYWGYNAYNAFNNTVHDPYDAWASDVYPSVTPQWLKYDFGAGNAQTIVQYSIRGRNHAQVQNPKDFKFQGSNDDINWDDLDSQTDVGELSPCQWSTYSIDNATAYRWYRLYITKANRDAHVIIGDMQMRKIIQTNNTISADQYDIRIERLTREYTSFKKNGDLYLAGVTESTYEDIAYRNTALLSLKIQATDQLQGTTPNVTVVARGRKVSVPDLQISGVTQTYDDCYWDDTAGTYKRISDDAVCTDTGNFTTQWTRNPVWCTRDFMLNSRYGLGEYIDADHFDDATAKTEAKYCWELVDDLNGGTEHRFEMDLPISRFTSEKEALKLLARNFRGWIIWSNDMYKIVIDRERDYVHTFNSSNMKPRSLKTTYLKQSQVLNFVEVQYADPNRNYNVQTLEIVDEDEWTNIQPLRKDTVNAIGTTRKSQALRDGRYHLNCSKYCTKIIDLDADIDAIHCEPGDTVRFQNDSLGWGVGGRVISATLTSITTNIDVSYTVDYKVRVRLSDGSYEYKTVISITNNNRTLNISGTFSSVPPVDSVFTYGAQDVDSKLFKILAFTIKSKHDCTVTAIEESANKYNDTTGVSLPDPIYSDLPDPAGAPDNVTDLSLTEMTNQPGFHISFNIPNDLRFHHADVMLSLDGFNYWIFRANVSENSDIEVIGTKPGQAYYVKVISYNSFGTANLSPVFATITITESVWIPPDVNGLRLDGEASQNTTIFTKKDAKFKWIRTSLTSGAGHLPAGWEELGAGEWWDEQYKFWVEIWVGGQAVRQEIVTDPAYVYTYEKNIADNGGIASSALTIKVWGYNVFENIKSSNSTDLSVSNPAPASITNLTAVAYTESIKFSWTPSTEIDFDHYLIRHKVESDSWSDWQSYSGSNFFRTLTQTEINLHGSDATIYFEIKAVDTFGNKSDVNSINGDAFGLNIEATDIEDFAITASKIFTKIPILDGDSWTDNSPSSGYIAWNNHKLYYNGVEYSITADNTNKKYIWWDKNDTPTTYHSSNTHPGSSLDDESFIIATNISGSHSLAWNAIANQVIGSAFIQDLAVQDAHIAEVTASKITATSLSSIVADFGTVTAGVAKSSNGLFYIDLDNKTLSVFSNTLVVESNKNTGLDWKENGVAKSATLTDDTYTPTTLAAHVQSVMRAAGDANTTVTYDSSDRKITIANSTLTSFELLWDSGGYSSYNCGILLGFDVESDDTGSLSYTGDYGAGLRVLLGEL